MSTLPLAEAAALYGKDESALRLMRGGHFAYTYSFLREDGECVLRILPPGDELDLRSQQAVMGWMRYLAENGAAVPEPLPSEDGNLVEALIFDRREWLILAMRRAPGVLSEELPLKQWTPALVQSLGRAVGRIHSLARRYVPPGGQRRPDWDAAGNLFNHPIPEQPWLARKQAAVLERVHKLPRGGDEYGMIHADLHFGNFFVEIPTRTITIFDFDDCVFGWYIMDLAVLLFDVLVLYDGEDRVGYGTDFLVNLLAGYRDENPVDRFWMGQLPLFLKLLEINLYTDLQALEGAESDDPWVSRFLPGCREKIEKDVPYIELDIGSVLDARPQVYAAPLAIRPKVRSRKAERVRLTERLPPGPRPIYSFWHELRALIAVKLYSAERISADRAARLAGLNRLQFLLGLGLYRIFPLEAELADLEKQDE
ncbi:MAG: phosphotransferase [Anaerolineales bacterium]|nr:phosphotransferase [Anaerolineales bacterium]